MKKFSTNKLLTTGIVLLAVTVLFVFFISVRQSQRVKDTARQLEHTEKVIQHIQKLVMAALDNETGARGFVITGKDAFLEPLVQSATAFKEEMGTMQRLNNEYPGEIRQLDSMEYYITRRLIFSDSMVKMKRINATQEVIALIEQGRGKFYTDQIRRIGLQMETREKALLAQRRERNERTIRNLNTILYSVLGSVLLLSVYMVHQVTKDIRTREANERKFSALLDAAPDATVIVDAQGIIKMINRQTEILFGYSRHEMIGQSVDILVPPDLRTSHVLHRNSFIKAPKVRTMGAGIELFAVKKDGSSFPVEISLSPIQTDEGMLVSAAVRDITERKNLETALRKSNEELEGFTYSVSHDLRAPLRGIIGFTSILQEDYNDKLDDEGRRITGIIKANTLKMGRLIDDLLSFSRLGRQPLAKSGINTQQLVNEIAEEFKKQPAHAAIQWDIQALPTVQADLTTLRQVWVNLISNAVKYSAGKPSPHISIGHYSEQEQEVFFVKDTGVGFDNKYRDKLFRVFQRLHSEAEFEGTGVGLALVEKIISKHGGKVWADAVLNEGATFFFSLPANNDDNQSFIKNH